MRSFPQWISNWARTLTWISRFWNDFLSPLLPTSKTYDLNLVHPLSSLPKCLLLPEKWTGIGKSNNHAKTCWDDQEPRINIIPALRVSHFFHIQKLQCSDFVLFFFQVSSVKEKRSVHIFIYSSDLGGTWLVFQPKKRLVCGQKGKTMNQQAKCRNQWEK